MHYVEDAKQRLRGTRKAAAAARRAEPAATSLPVPGHEPGRRAPRPPPPDASPGRLLPLFRQPAAAAALLTMPRAGVLGLLLPAAEEQVQAEHHALARLEGRLVAAGTPADVAVDVRYQGLMLVLGQAWRRHVRLVHEGRRRILRDIAQPGQHTQVLLDDVWSAIVWQGFEATRAVWGQYLGQLRWSEAREARHPMLAVHHDLRASLRLVSFAMRLRVEVLIQRGLPPPAPLESETSPSDPTPWMVPVTGKET